MTVESITLPMVISLKGCGKRPWADSLCQLSHVEFVREDITELPISMVPMDL